MDLVDVSFFWYDCPLVGYSMPREWSNRQATDVYDSWRLRAPCRAWQYVGNLRRSLAVTIRVAEAATNKKL